MPWEEFSRKIEPVSRKFATVREYCRPEQREWFDRVPDGGFGEEAIRVAKKKAAKKKR